MNIEISSENLPSLNKYTGSVSDLVDITSERNRKGIDKKTLSLVNKFSEDKKNIKLYKNPHNYLSKVDEQSVDIKKYITDLDEININNLTPEELLLFGVDMYKGATNNVDVKSKTELFLKHVYSLSNSTQNNISKLYGEVLRLDYIKDKELPNSTLEKIEKEKKEFIETTKFDGSFYVLEKKVDEKVFEGKKFLDNKYNKVYENTLGEKATRLANLRLNNDNSLAMLSFIKVELQNLRYLHDILTFYNLMGTDKQRDVFKKNNNIK